MTHPQPSPTCCVPCADRGWLALDRGEIACSWCRAGQEIRDHMTAMLQRPSRDRSDLMRILVDELTRSWTDHDLETHAGLLALVAVHDVPVHMENKDGKGGKVTGSPMPCAPDVMNLLGDITAGVLGHEKTLRALLGYSRLRRSSTLRSVCSALDALPDLCARVHEQRPAHWSVTGRVVLRAGKPTRKPGSIERDLNAWHRKCREVIGADRRWARVPTTCPVCGQSALRQRPRDGSVVCTKCGEVWTESELGWLADVSTRTS